MTEWKFDRMASEWCVYRRETPTGIVIFVVHVDDIISAGSTPAANEHFKTQLRSKWEISDLGPAKFALGIAITRDMNTRTIGLSQTALIDRVVEQFRQKDAHPKDMPMVGGL